MSGGRALVGVALALVLASLPAAVWAQSSAPVDPRPPQSSATCTETPAAVGVDSDPCNTPYTPVALDIETSAEYGWRQAGGAVFPGAEGDARRHMGYRDPGPAGGGIPHTVDFFTVSFLNPSHGFAAGAACEDPAADGDELASCVRVPVIYRYDPVEGWREVYRGRDSTGDGRGFVGALAWVPPSHDDAQQLKAVAVGGDGIYPRREPGDGSDPAGDGLAWVLVGDGAWRRISVTSRMRGMTALDFSPRPFDCGTTSECGFAGGYRQLWMWKDGSFAADPSYEYSDPDPSTCLTAPTSPQTSPLGALGPSIALACQPRVRDSPFRVRQIRFAPKGSEPRALAATSGCCYVNPATGERDPAAEYPRLMQWTNGTWTAGGISLNDHGRGRAQTLLFPDSYYSVTYTGAGGTLWSIVASPGGPPPADGAGESASQIIQCMYGATSDPAAGEGAPCRDDVGAPSEQIINPNLSTVRLVAGDGDLEGHRRVWPGVGGGLVYPGPDGIMDWGLGELTESCHSPQSLRDCQAVAYTTTTRSRALGGLANPLLCPDGGAASATDCQVDDAFVDQLKSRYLMSLPSYTVNAFAMVGKTGIGWAAGDRGALLSLGMTGAGASGSGSAATTWPAVGNAQATPLSDRAAYDLFRPTVPGKPGLVPPLAARPIGTMPSPRFLSAGSPDPHPDPAHLQSIREIVVSRDGSEGWAVGPSRNKAGGKDSAAMTLYHLAGERWRRCDPRGIAGALPADRACASLRELASIDGAGIKFVALARLPFENDPDPSNDDQFEVVALVRFPEAADKPLFLRYRQGTWSVDEPLSSSVGLSNAVDATIAFGTPDDGWLVVRPLNAGQSHLYQLMRPSPSEPAQWKRCTVQANGTDCNDPDSALPLHAAGPGGNDEVGGTLRVTSAGERVYLYGTRGTLGAGNRPVILREDPDSGNRWTQDFDPKHGVGADASFEGKLTWLSVAQAQDRSYSGWAIGDFTPEDGDRTPLLRVSPDGARWRAVSAGAPVSEYLSAPEASGRVVALPGPAGSGPAFAAHSTDTASPRYPMVWFNPARDAWEVFEAPFQTTAGGADAKQQANVDALASDNRGGLWIGASPRDLRGGTWLYRYTNRVPRPVFSDVHHPVRELMTATAAGGDGSFWVATDAGTVYRYDRITGWDRVAIRGWDPPRTIVRSPIHAIAVGIDGRGVVVGKHGRIASVDSAAARLDPATVACRERPDGCGGGTTLRAAAVAPDGSALVGGDRRTVLWRPAGGEFGAAAKPAAAGDARITAVALPTPARAWLTTDTGDVFAGSLEAGGWRWVRESLDDVGSPLSRDRFGVTLQLNAIAMDAKGHGYAIGDRGLILERRPGAERPWRRLAAGYGEDLLSVTLGPGGEGALIGGDGGLVLTRAGNNDFAVARASDYFDPIASPSSDPTGIGGVVGVALLPGYEAGEVEAWAAMQLPRTSRRTGLENRTPPPAALLHHLSDGSHPLLDGGGGRAAALPDAPAREEGEVRFAAFGKSDCQWGGPEVCPEFTGSLLAHEVVARRVRDALRGDAERYDFALFTGDVADVAGGRTQGTTTGVGGTSPIHRRWLEQIARPLDRAGLPLYGALGRGDLSFTQVCPLGAGFRCGGTRQMGISDNLVWRREMRDRPAPWGAGDSPASASGVTFRPVRNRGVNLDRTVERTAAGEVLAGARIHYAFDVVRDGRALVRVVFVDTSLRSLAASDALQNPVEEQLTWVREVLRSRPEGTRAVVVSNTPTYSYGPGAGSDTQTDATAFESVLMQERVDLVVSGRLGWNARYFAHAPGVHEPCPGGEYQEAPSSSGPGLCGQSGSSDPIFETRRLSEALEGLGAPPPPDPASLLGAAGIRTLPFAIASSAGGRLGPNGEGQSRPAREGFWHGYTTIRLSPDGDFAPIVEQRPVFDWIGIRAVEHTLRPGQRLDLQGYGREPVGLDQPIRYAEKIDSPAITHRYDLLLADDKRPWLPKEDADGSYVPVPPHVATIDRQTGRVRAGRGNHPRVYAIALLSVGEQAATWPLVFEPRRSFRPKPPAVVAPALPGPIVSAAGASLPAPPQPPVPSTQAPSFELPAPPPIPGLPSASATPPQPPAPPALPPPPVSPQATPLDLVTSPVGLNVAPQATVIPPPAPPIQPAPPSGARREARQRQAATQKSGADVGPEGAGETGFDPEETYGPTPLIDSEAQLSTRLEPGRETLPFTRLMGAEQPSAWARALLYGGSLGVAALLLALAWGARPGPRRREPRLPAPARNWSRRL